MKSTTVQHSIYRIVTMLSKVTLSVVVTAGMVGNLRMNSAIAEPSLQQSPILIATAYTDLTLPTLKRGDRGRNVELLQKILSDNGFLHAAGVRLGNPRGAVVDGIFGAITESAVRDLQQRYQNYIPVTGQVNPSTWEVLDMQENPYRSLLPWKSQGQ